MSLRVTILLLSSMILKSRISRDSGKLRLAIEVSVTILIDSKICVFFRIIEIAGGRELYSQSRTKAVRKLRHNNTQKHNMRNKVRSLIKQSVDYPADNINEVNL